MARTAQSRRSRSKSPARRRNGSKGGSSLAEAKRQNKAEEISSSSHKKPQRNGLVHRGRGRSVSGDALEDAYEQWGDDDVLEEIAEVQGQEVLLDGLEEDGGEEEVEEESHLELLLTGLRHVVLSPGGFFVLSCFAAPWILEQIRPMGEPLGAEFLLAWLVLPPRTPLNPRSAAVPRL